MALDTVFAVQLNVQSVSSTSEIPFFVAPRAGYIDRVTYAQQLSVIPNPGTAAEGTLVVRLKNVTTGNYITAELSASGLSLLKGLDFTLATTEINTKFSSGDVFTVNWTATSNSAGTGPGIAIIGLHLKDGRFGRSDHLA